MISVKHLTKSYGDRPAIHDLEFQINKGEIVGFLGPNGAGKTTTMKIITGYMAPTSGKVEVGGFDVFEKPKEVKQQIGYLPETPPLYLDMKVDDYLSYVAKLRLVKSDQVGKFVDEAIEKVNLESVKSRLIQNLSKGFRQRVGLAQALVSKPDILILDEPTVGLDPKQVAEMRGLFSQLKGHHTIILSTHILPEVQASCDRIIIINQGKIVAKDSIQNLTASSKASGKVLVRVSRVQEGLISLIEKIEGVTTVEVKDNALTIGMNGKEDVIEKLSDIIVSSGSGLLHLNSQFNELENIFIELTDNHKEQE